MAPPPSSNQPPQAGDRKSPDPVPPTSPGDEAPPGTPGTGEAVCRACGGTGRAEGRDCPTCSGTGVVTVGIGGG